METKNTHNRSRDYFKTLLVFVTFVNLLMAFTSCSNVELEEMLDKSDGMYLKTDAYQHPQQDEWELRSVYFLSKKDTAFIEACMTRKSGEEKWTYISKVDNSQKREMQAFTEYLSNANVDSCTDSTIVIGHLGKYLKAGWCSSVPGTNSPYKVIGVWKQHSKK